MKRRVALTVTLIAVSCSGAPPKQDRPAQMTPEPAEAERPTPPDARRVPHETKIGDETIVDPYHWLRERDDPKVIAYLEAENAHTDQMTRHTKELRETLYAEMLSHIEETDLSAPYRHGDYWYYTRTKEGKNYPILCRKEELDSAEEVLLDQNERAKGHDFYAVGVAEPSPGHELLAFSEDVRGNERYTLRFKNLETGEIVGESIPDTSYYAVWGNDDETIFYTRVDETNRSHRLYRHVLGTDPKDDELLYEETDEKFRVIAYRSRSDDYVLMGLHSAVTTEYWFLDADDPRGDFRRIAPRRQDVEYYPEHHGDRFFILTNDDATNFELVETPVDAPGVDNWDVVIEGRDDVTLDGVDAFANHLVVRERTDGLPRFRVRNTRSGREHYVEFPESAYAAWSGDNYTWETTKFRVEYTSLVTPRSVYDWDMEAQNLELVKRTDVPDYDASLYETKRLHARADDGTEVPISLVYRKGLFDDGPARLLLAGYGAYGASYDPYFSSSRLSLLDRGVAFGIAHVRGGGDLGRAWYEDGKYLNKKNTFSDFIACAEHLVAADYTRPDRLAISGRSAGGLLVGAVTNMRPGLFDVVVADVPFVDVLNTMLDPTIPLTVTEWEEWGDPRKPEFFEYIRSYSPYDNVHDADYPDMLITAGLNDPRVQYWEPAKWTAKLRDHDTGDSVILLETNMAAGHGGASGRYDYLKEIAFEYAFILDRLP